MNMTLSVAIPAVEKFLDETVRELAMGLDRQAVLDQSVRADDLFEAFLKWCSESGRNPLTKDEFERVMRQPHRETTLRVRPSGYELEPDDAGVGRWYGLTDDEDPQRPPVYLLSEAARRSAGHDTQQQ